MLYWNIKVPYWHQNVSRNVFWTKFCCILSFITTELHRVDLKELYRVVILSEICDEVDFDKLTNCFKYNIEGS